MSADYKLPVREIKTLWGGEGDPYLRLREMVRRGVGGTEGVERKRF